MPKWLDLRRLFARGEGARGVADELTAAERAARRVRRVRVALAAFGVVVLGALGAALGAGPWTKQRAIDEAAERGVELSVADADVGFLSVTLRGVEARPEGVPGVRAHFDTVRVGVGLGLSIDAVEVQGGQLEVSGSLDHVRKSLEGWRERHRTARTDKATAPSKTRYLASGVSLAWRGAFGEKTLQTFSGLQFERSGEGQRLGLDHVRFEHPSGSLEMAGVIANWRRGEQGFTLDEAEIAVARVHARAPEQGDADKATDADEAAAGAPTPGTEPLTEEDVRTAAKKGVPGAALERAREKARELAASEGGLLGRLPPVDAERGARLRRLVTRGVESLSGRLPSKTRVKALWLELARGQEKLHLGPSTLDVVQTQAALSLALIPHGEAKGTPLSLRAELPRHEGPVHLRLEGGPVSLSTLGVREGDFGLVGVALTEVGGLLDVQLSGNGDALAVEGDARVSRATLHNQRIAPRPVSIEAMRLAAKGNVLLSGARYTLDKSELQVGQAAFQLAGSLERGTDHVAAKVRGGTPLVACQALLDSAPRGLLDRVEQMKMDGTLALDVGVELDTRRLGAMQVRFDLKNDCRITEVPASLSTQRFAVPFEHEVLGPDGMPMVVETGPGTAAWTRGDGMPQYLETAVLVCEDGRFFGHRGFDGRAIESSIRDNVSAGRFLRGASTVTMQLAKNLYLSRDKQLSRKFQEAALTLLLEQELTKPQLLELYFNVVEFGPGVYGIRQAAQHYFGTTPDHLTIGQSFFLVSILPNPKRLYFDESGKLLAGRVEYLHRLMNIAYDRGRLTDVELAAGLAEEVRLGPPAAEVPAPGAPAPGGTENEAIGPSGGLPSATPGRAAPQEMSPGFFPRDNAGGP